MRHGRPQRLWDSTRWYGAALHEGCPPLISRQIVPQISAVLPGAANVEPIAMSKNHLTMTKFQSGADSDLQSVSDHIAFMTEDAPSKVARVWDVESEKLGK